MAFTFTGYNQSYLEETSRKAGSPLADQIYRNRWDIITQRCTGGTLLDYGCGTGAFHSLAPAGFTVSGWDINPYSAYFGRRPTGTFDILTMWDVMEHLHTPLGPALCYRPQWAFIATPNAACAPMPDFTAWRHYKPSEHVQYYTPKTLAMSMASIGYEAVCVDYSEGALRDRANPKAIFTAVFKCYDN